MNRKLNTESFIQEAKNIHGNLYNYDDTIFTKMTNKIIIVCNNCQIRFEQAANKHLSGQGCKKCSREKNGIKRRYTTEAFINKANTIHNYKYRYAKTVYITDKENIIITCDIHGDFTQRACYHLQGHGCQSCGGSIKKTLDEFIHKANIIHSNKYSYIYSIYKDANSKLIITCPTHGNFEQTPAKHLTRQQGCPQCSDCYPYTYDTYIQKANIIHNSVYNYKYTEFTGINNKLVITCNIHGNFEQLAASHLRGCGCPTCGRESSGNSRRSILSDFILDAQYVHGDKYNYDKVIYITAKTFVTITCYEHGDFIQKPDYHLHGGGCPKCNPRKPWSKISLEWLELIKNESPNLEYILNMGEHLIKNSKFKADGYDPATNHIYEFHGCYWHGCTCKNSSLDDNTKAIQELRYRRTLEREEYIKSQGYLLTTMWECQWNTIKKDLNLMAARQTKFEIENQHNLRQNEHL
jgi:hypothetical protein